MNEDSTIIKDQLNIIKNTTTNLVNEYSDSVRSSIQPAIDIIMRNKLKFILGFILIFSIVLYLAFIFLRVERYLAVMDRNFTNQAIIPLKSQKGIKKHSLRDYYVLSSYKSYLPCTNYYDFSDIRAIKYALKYGARCINLDVMRSSLSPKAEPVIAYGNERGNYRYTTSISFDDTINHIVSYAFSSEVPSRSDPLFIYLSLQTDYDTNMYNKIATSIKKYCIHKMPDKSLNYQGRLSGRDIASIPIIELIDKIVIICDKNVENTELDELTHICAETRGNFRIKRYLDMRETTNLEEEREYSKTGLTMVVPPIDTRDKKNMNYNVPYYMGCQFLMMNMNIADKHMMTYMKRFEKSSFILKPYRLRYHPTFIKPPVKQSAKVSMAPEKVSTPGFEFSI